ncbi:MAG: hypothetical protein IT160_01705 [Bryobacterales bacterium]|nr:hypothetical protein [Bryobacterales bacterium]
MTDKFREYMQTVTEPLKKHWKLPPLILHPFSDAGAPGKLVESSRANLMMQGLLPAGEFSVDELDRRLIDGRYCEVRMLFYVGRDLLRWIGQCMDLAGRDEELSLAGVQAQSFARLLVEDPPESVREKLNRWGVADYKAIFSRALGLNAVFSEAPSCESLTTDFIRNYYRFADAMYLLWQRASEAAEIGRDTFDFDLYASGEYSRMLEREWESETE